MKADLYICNETFSHNSTDSFNEVKMKLSDFQIMLERIVEYSDENSLYLVKEGFMSTIIFGDGRTITEILSDYHTSITSYGKDILTLIISIFKHCKNSNISIDVMKDYLNMEDAMNCSAIVVLNPLKGFEKNVQVLSNVKGWLQFRRFFLAKYPHDAHFFIEESKKYFPNLLIHEGTKATLKNVLDTHPQQIVKYLSVLNDDLITEFNNVGGGDLNSFLIWFKSKHNLDGASFEGKKENKFYFNFPDGTNAYCEPHLKMYKDDAGNHNQHCRIHFKTPKTNESKVYVGCICQHL